MMDGLGNWTKFYDNSGTPETRTHNAVNELTARDATNLAYDDNGNLTDDGTYEYEYDALNRLIKVLKKGSPDITVGEYAYDALNRRIWRKSDEDQSGSQETELYYIHDGQREIEERVYSDEDLKRDYVYGNYIDEPIFGRSDNNNDGDFSDSKEQFYYCHNNLYNIAVLLDTSGNIIESYAYKPYGKPTIYTSDGGDGDWFDGDETTGSLTGNYYLFTGRRYDPEAEQYYYRKRPYKPILGRFPSRDPIFDVNLYWYVSDSPINFTDPMGLNTNDVIKDVYINIKEGLIGSREKLTDCISRANVFYEDRKKNCEEKQGACESECWKNFPTGGCLGEVVYPFYRLCIDQCTTGYGLCRIGADAIRGAMITWCYGIYGGVPWGPDISWGL